MSAHRATGVSAGLFLVALAVALVVATENGRALLDRFRPSPSAPAAAASDDTVQTPSTRKRTELPVEGIVVERSPFVQSVRATGRVEAHRRAELAAPVGERIELVAVTEGAHVERGDVLVRLDPRPFEIARNEATARLSIAEADYRLQLLDDADPDPEREEQAAHRSGLTEARERLERARLDLEGSVLRAPFAGEVVAVEADLGERAEAGRALVTLVDLHLVRVRAEILETDFGRIETGADVRVQLPAFPDETFAGRVTALGPEIDPDRGTGVAYVEIPNPGGRLKPGMYARVEVAGAVHADRLSVPRDAVLERDRKLLVFRAADGRAEWQYVETGLESRDRIEIVSGLAPGDTVLVAGHLTLAHGAPVKVRIRED